MTAFDELIQPAAGFITRAQLLDHGLDDRVIRSWMRQGLIVRIRHGVYALAEEHARLSPEQKHAVVAMSVATKLGPGVAVSHQSACAIHGIATYGLDLSTVHIIRLDGSVGRHEHGLVHHTGHIVTDDEVEEMGDVLVVKPARAVFETAMTSSVESGIVTLDSGLHLAKCSVEELQELGRRMRSWRGARRARFALGLADARSESPGESRSRFQFRRAHLPRPDLQVAVHDEDGVLLGVSDFGWLKYRHLGEFDGGVKYGGIATDLRTPQQIVIAEKWREDSLRAQLLGMSRWGWRDIDPARVAVTMRRIGAQLEQSRRLYDRNRTHIPLS